jgi:acetyl-CoA C-acetyltransferase
VQRALAAMSSGELAHEIAPLRVGEASVSEDEQPRRARLDRIKTLRGAFKEGGSITAANSSSISDGASALVLATDAAVDEFRLAPLARIVGHATHARLLESLKWRVEDVDLFEINEAFAMVTMIAIRELGLPEDRVNVYGGACAQGHPIGSTGSRLIVTLAHALAQRGGKRAIAALCIGGGEATAIALERA